MSTISVEETPLLKRFWIIQQLRVRFAEGYFNLRKWRTNVGNLRKLISETAQNDNKPEKILGVLWDKIDGIFIFDFKEIFKLSHPISDKKKYS